MNRSICLVSLVLFSLTGSAQHIILSGRVTDAESREPLSYVSIFLKTTSINTVSNADGEFELTVPDSFASDTLTISAMGYASYRVRVSDIEIPRRMSVRLRLKPIPLEEVIIRENKIKAEDIVRLAFDNVENNFPTMPYKLNGFFREMHLEDNRSVQLMEAAIDVYGIGHANIKGSRPGTQVKVDLKNVRASKNYRHDCFRQSVVERYNLVIGGLTHDPVRRRPANVSQWIRGKTFTTDSVTYLNDKLVYVVSFLTYLQKYPNFERKNTLYIDAEDYFIYRYMWEEYAKEGKYSEKEWPLTKQSVYLTSRKRLSTTYDYGKYKGKMYLKYFHEECYDDIINASTNSVVFESFGHITLIVGQIETENVVFPKEETIKRDQSLATQITEYDPAFWINFEQVKVVPLTRKSIRDLEKEMPLEQQFKFEGSHK